MLGCHTMLDAQREDIGRQGIISIGYTIYTITPTAMSTSCRCLRLTFQNVIGIASMEIPVVLMTYLVALTALFDGCNNGVSSRTADIATQTDIALIEEKP